MTISQRALKYENTGVSGRNRVIDTYNTIKPLPRGYKVKYSDSWCATFVSAMAYLEGMKNFPFECSVSVMVKLAKNKGIWKSTNPKINDLVIYDWGNNGTQDHIGIIYKVSQGNLYVIEGNKNNDFGTRKISTLSNVIEGYITTYQPLPTLNSNGVEGIAKDVIKGLYGTGQNRKDSIYSKVQTRVNNILKNQLQIQFYGYDNRAITQVAYDVIANKYSNGDERKNKLYNTIQSKVNELI